MISLLLSTRNRPEALRRMVKSAVVTARGELEFCVAVDDDDEVSVPVLEEEGVPFWVLIVEGLTQSQRLNALALRSRGDLLMIAADDLLFRTSGWDWSSGRAMEKLGGLGLVGLNDRHWGRTIVTHPVLSRSLAQRLGGVARDCFAHYYIDTYLTLVADCAGCLVYLPGVVVEHLHPSNGGSEEDETYQRNQEFFERDRAAFEECVITRLAADVRAVQGAMTP